MQDAEEYATALDAVPEKERGPLHGIPVSIKVEHLHILIPRSSEKLSKVQSSRLQKSKFSDHSH